MGTEIVQSKGNGGGQIMTGMDAQKERDMRDLVRRAIFPDATDDELSLYVHDCQRQGVHPLDRLIHPTIRTDKKTGQRRYTPITSIDLMRSRADEEGTYAGNDEPTYEGEPNRPGFSATVVVWKIVGGVRCPFPGTARWEEYYPGDEQGFMWRAKGPLMLGKCAEARALRKAFPRKLGRMYAREEMDRVDEGWSDVTAIVPAHTPAPARVPTATVVQPTPRAPQPQSAPPVEQHHGQPVESKPVEPGTGQAPGRPSVDWNIPAGKGKRMKMSEASDDHLAKFIQWQEAERDAGKWAAQWAQRNQEQLDRAKEWLAFKAVEEAALRSSEPPQDDVPPPDAQGEFDDAF